MNILTMSKIYWFTGQPGAGKTELAKILKKHLLNYTTVYHIDGDDLRDLVRNKDYSKEGRVKNIELAQSIAKYLHNQQATVIVSLVSPYLELRELFKSEIGEELVEIYVHTTDVRGREQFHVEDYQKPETNFISIDTTGKSVSESYRQLKTELNG
jgi:adenylylsulfate kinase-like enzyme